MAAILCLCGMRFHKEDVVLSAPYLESKFSYFSSDSLQQFVSARTIC